LGRYPLIAFKLKNVRVFVGMGLDFRSNALALGPEVFKHFLATPLLTVIRVQNFEPTLWFGGIRREPMFANDALQVFVADGPEQVYALGLEVISQ
jgi:hypothetical protein